MKSFVLHNVCQGFSFNYFDRFVFMYGSVRKNGRIFINKGNSSLSDSISYIELRFESECYRLLLNAEAVKECSMMFTLVISN